MGDCESGTIGGDVTKLITTGLVLVVLDVPGFVLIAMAVWLLSREGS